MTQVGYFRLIFGVLTPRRVLLLLPVCGVLALAIYFLPVLIFGPQETPRPAQVGKSTPEPSLPEGPPPPGLPIVAWGKRHHFPVIRDPWYVRADQKQFTPADSEPVLGLVINGQARAYSTNQLNENEMVVDEVAGVPILVTY